MMKENSVLASGLDFMFGLTIVALHLSSMAMLKGNQVWGQTFTNRLFGTLGPLQ